MYPKVWFPLSCDWKFMTKVWEAKQVSINLPIFFNLCKEGFFEFVLEISHNFPWPSINTSGIIIKWMLMKQAIPERGYSRVTRENIAMVLAKVKQIKLSHRTKFLIVWPRVIPVLDVRRDDEPCARESIDKNSLPKAILTFFPSQSESEKFKYFQCLVE